MAGNLGNALPPCPRPFDDTGRHLEAWPLAREATAPHRSHTTLKTIPEAETGNVEKAPFVFGINSRH
jgi:hypothetical protein